MMKKIEILVMGEVIIDKPIPQVIATCIPDMRSDELIYLHRKLADQLEEGKATHIDVDDLINQGEENG